MGASILNGMQTTPVKQCEDEDEDEDKEEEEEDDDDDEYVTCL